MPALTGRKIRDVADPDLVGAAGAWNLPQVIGGCGQCRIGDGRAASAPLALVACLEALIAHQPPDAPPPAAHALPAQFHAYSGGAVGAAALLERLADFGL